MKTPLPLFSRTPAWFAAGVLLAAATMAQSPSADPPAPPAAADREPLAADGLRPVDRSFFDRVADLSQQQIALARLAVSHALRADIRTFAQQLAADHRQITDSVQNLRRRRGADTEEAVGPPSVGESYGRLSQVTGSEFDRGFVVAIEALQGRTLTLFEQVISQTKDAEIRDLIGGYLPMLRDHQNQATELKRELD